MEERVFCLFQRFILQSFFLFFLFFFFLRNVFLTGFFFSKGSFFQNDFVEVCFFLIFVVFLGKNGGFCKSFLSVDSKKCFCYLNLF